MRIGLFLESSSDEQGGGFQQGLSTIEALTSKNGTTHEFLVFTPSEQTRQLLLKEGIKAIRFKEGVFRLIDRWSATVVGNAVLRRLWRRGFRRVGRHLDALLDDYRIDLVVLNEITDSVLRIGDHPFITTIWDLSHRDCPEFPETYADRAFERRERQLANSLTRSLAVITNSPSGARQIARVYQVDPARIVELPFIPPLVIRRHAAGQGLATAEDVRRKYELPERYVFYPAYFTPFKNHLYILEGLVELERRQGVVLSAVFCGGDGPPHRATVERQVKALGLTARVRFLGFVPDEDIPALYEGALALVMPTYSGPTNLPPLEAVTLGCPVIYSDLPEFREQMGEAALYCDLTDVSSLANHLATLIQDSSVLKELKIKGRKLAAHIAKIDYGERLAPIFDEYAYARRRWTWPEAPRDCVGLPNNPALGDRKKRR
jgi:glycosyltransferase involved in cell wall biosynthesis